MNAEQIKKLRKRLGLTQMKFAKLLNVSFATENRWERGHTVPLPDRMAKLVGLKKPSGKRTSRDYALTVGDRHLRVDDSDFAGRKKTMIFTASDLERMLQMVKWRGAITSYSACLASKL